MQYNDLYDAVVSDETSMRKLVELEVDVSRYLTHKRDAVLHSQITREVYRLGRRLRLDDSTVLQAVIQKVKFRVSDLSGKRYQGRMDEHCPVCGAELTDFARDRVYTYEADTHRDVSYVTQAWNLGRELHRRYRCCDCDSIWEDVWMRTTWSGNETVRTYGKHGKVLVDGRVD